jgi:hypothetical protein
MTKVVKQPAMNKLDGLQLDSIIHPGLNLQEDICGSGVTNGTLLELLIRNCDNFVKQSENAKVKEISFDNCGKGNGYLSLVVKVYINFDNGTTFSLVLKVPMPDAIKKMISNGNQVKEETNVCLDHKKYLYYLRMKWTKTRGPLSTVTIENASFTSVLVAR